MKKTIYDLLNSLENILKTLTLESQSQFVDDQLEEIHDHLDMIKENLVNIIMNDPYLDVYIGNLEKNNEKITNKK
jgi:molecular chaperone GrpE (heat shock protein)